MTRRLLICVAALMLITQPALAHIDVSPEEAARGSVTTFTFTVPNEEAPAKTTKVEVFFPDGSTFDEINPQAVAGWNASATKTSATWDGGTIAGEDEVDFQLELGPLPNGDSLTFRVLQTYDNGEVVRWIDAPLPGGGEPDHPAPSVRLTGAAVLPSTTTTPGATTIVAPDVDDDDDDGGVGVGIVALIVAATAVLAAGAGFALQRRRRAS